MRQRDINKGVIKRGTVVYKKVYKFDINSNLSRSYILELITLEDGVVPYEARRAYNQYNRLRKCRVPAVYVVSATAHNDIFSSLDATKDPLFETIQLVSAYDPDFIYTVGSVVRSDRWNADMSETCTHGIHVYLTRKEAERH